MSEIFFKDLEIPSPEINLNIGSGLQGIQTGLMLKKIEKVLIQQNPDLVLVYGDTNTTLAGALAAVKLQIPIGHIEAGLRSFNKNMPEEVNRIISDHCSNLLFVPTLKAVKNLRDENISMDKIYLTGDVMYDAVLHYEKKSKGFKYLYAKYGIKKNQFILATVHRAENTNNAIRLKNIIQALNNVSYENEVILPLHPRTKKFLKTHNISFVSDKLKIIEPVGYLEMIFLEANSKLIVTDSGGVQKEAYFFQKPCLTLRDETEWVELIESGCNKLTSPDSQNVIVNNIRSFYNFKFNNSSNFYGHGHAASKIANIIVNYL
jgi:UDP-GlcNAc3NAcA epimerase